MDFAKLATADRCDQPSVMVVIDPTTGDPYVDADGNTSTISLLGSEGRTYQSFINAETQKHLDVLTRRSRTARSLNAEAQVKSRIDIAAKCTRSWANINWDGKPLECNAVNAAMLYGQCPWLLDQVETHMSAVENYLEKG